MNGKTVITEDTIMVKDLPCTAGSKMLENFIAPFDACVTERLKGAGCETGRTLPPGEFGLGGSYAGGDLCGAVKAVAKGNKYALSNDLWGTVRRQALQNNLAFLYPSYGRVSRYGLVQSVSSMDQIGILAGKAEDAFKLLETVAGYDERDGMSLMDAEYRIPGKKRKIKAGRFESALPLEETFLILAAAEFANNISRYDGVKFGYRAKAYKNINDLYIKSRTEGLGLDAILYAITGNIVLSQEYYGKYYDKAARIRRLIKNELCGALSEFDVLETAANDAKYLTLSPLTGCPSLTFVKNGVPATALAKHTDEDALYSYIAQ